MMSNMSVTPEMMAQAQQMASRMSPDDWCVPVPVCINVCLFNFLVWVIASCLQMGWWVNQDLVGGLLSAWPAGAAVTYTQNTAQHNTSPGAAAEILHGHRQCMPHSLGTAMTVRVRLLFVAT